MKKMLITAICFGMTACGNAEVSSSAEPAAKSPLVLPEQKR